MASPSDKLAESLTVLKTLQDSCRIAIRSEDLSRTHRERLLGGGFIREVMKGWYVPSRPDEPEGESTSWYASFWSFSAAYLNERFGDEWCLSPEQSISLHTGDLTVPKQLLVRSPRGGNKPTNLLYETSIFDVRLDLPPASDIEVRDGIATAPSSSVDRCTSRQVKKQYASSCPPFLSCWRRKPNPQSESCSDISSSSTFTPTWMETVGWDDSS